MLATILLATTLAAGTRHMPVQGAAQPVVAVRERPERAADATANVLAYCDANGQPTIVLTNAGATPLVVEWTLTSFQPGYPPDTWSNVSHLEPGRFEGWMSPAPYLHLDYRYDDDGQVVTDSILASCPGTAGWVGAPGGRDGSHAHRSTTVTDTVRSAPSR